MPKIADNLTQVRSRIQHSALAAGRNPRDITLLAVSKTRPAADIRAAVEAGQREFGENYVQEALTKMAQLQTLDLVWHLIGPLQSNKTRAVAEHFHWVHTVDRLSIAERLSRQRPECLPPLQVCLQVNIDDAPQKAGCRADQVAALAQAVAGLPRLRLRGLMAIPDPDGRTAPFVALAELSRQVSEQTGVPLDTLSMGMSDDMDAAIAAGSTLLRVGTAIFGARS